MIWSMKLGSAYSIVAIGFLLFVVYMCRWSSRSSVAICFVKLKNPVGSSWVFMVISGPWCFGVLVMLSWSVGRWCFMRGSWVMAWAMVVSVSMVWLIRWRW